MSYVDHGVGGDAIERRAFVQRLHLHRHVLTGSVQLLKFDNRALQRSPVPPNHFTAGVQVLHLGRECAQNLGNFVFVWFNGVCFIVVCNINKKVKK